MGKQECSRIPIFSENILSFHIHVLIVCFQSESLKWFNLAVDWVFCTHFNNFNTELSRALPAGSCHWSYPLFSARDSGWTQYFSSKTLQGISSHGSPDWTSKPVYIKWLFIWAGMHSMASKWKVLNMGVGVRQSQVYHRPWICPARHWNWRALARFQRLPATNVHKCNESNKWETAGWNWPVSLNQSKFGMRLPPPSSEIQRKRTKITPYFLKLKKYEIV